MTATESFLTITHRQIDPLTGEERDISAHFMLTTPTGDPRYPYMAQTHFPDTGYVSTGFSYQFSSLEEFRDEQLRKLVAEGARWVKGNAERREAQRVAALYHRDVRFLLVNRGVDEFILQVFDYAVDQYPESYDAISAYVRAEYKTDGAFRKAMRAAVSAGKENAREEYPDVYREEDSKDDFYRDYIADVAEGALSAM